ncbi:PQQ-binding-like beta-propeller repeat protein [Tahibacter amnicola]|uniref:PQQ-binding-like beta-propeller repeat protein n=1 Tax=Tahibacter amnicola TaxID=2976241 RepID=A0ABY6BH17_9GAMM|nr:PQQ-binding-like beta-propeller repeat protein [Tahibacter amnicola]UXI69321.1 PQQ-binding-like beta-propeller repeat protein [Tahibacter amnicola]
MQTDVPEAGSPVLQRVSAAGEVLWTSTDPVAFTSGMVRPVRDGVWFQGSNALIRLGLDGVKQAEVAGAHIYNANLAAVDLASGKLAGVVHTTVNGQESVSLAQYDRAGKRLWSVSTIVGGQLVTFDQLRWTADGDLIALGHSSTDGAGAAIRISATGSVRWAKLYPGLQGRSFSAVAAQPGSVFATAANAADHVMVKLDSAGELSWVRPLATVAECQPECPIVASSDGGVAAMTITAPAQLRRLDRAGTALPAVALPEIAHAVATADGRFAAGANPAPGDAEAVDAYRIDTSGQVVATYRRPHMQGRSQVWWMSFDDAGNTYALHGPFGTTKATLARIDPDGQVLWQRELDTPVAEFASGSRSTDRLCVTAATSTSDANRTIQLHCFRTADGAALWSREVARPFDDAYYHSTSVHPNGSVYVNYMHYMLTSKLQKFAADGTPAPAQDIDAPFNDALEVNGFTALWQGFEQPARSSLALVDSTGRLRYSTRGTFSRGFNSWALAEDGSIAVIGGIPGYHTVKVVQLWDANGRNLWETPLPGPGYIPKVVMDRENIYLVNAGFYSEHGRYAHSLWCLSRADGAIRWKTDLGQPASAIVAAVLAGDDIVLLGTGPSIGIQRVNRQSGQLVGERNVGCGGSRCLTFYAGADRNGGIRVQSRSEQLGGRARQTVYYSSRPAAPVSPIRVDQAGIAGAWWSTYGNGEGLVLDWLPDSRTLFMPWFTYGTTRVNHPSGQRWYTLSAGAVAEAATSVEMAINESAGGQFTAGPAGTTTRVGTATLTFDSCDKASLRYRFDTGEKAGLSGVLSLDRLAAASADCLMADGTTRPGTGLQPPAGGFDSRMGGTWYDPGNSGQGLQLAIQPGGVLFAPWFTYDPAGTANDPTRQHWFVLSGSLAQSSGGRVTVPIVQAVGGKFDSVPTSNFTVVGSATLAMQACDRAKLDYRFDSGELAGPYAGKTGTVNLVKVGGCAP